MFGIQVHAIQMFTVLDIVSGSGELQCHCYDFVHENVGNPALNTKPTILNHFLCIFTVLEMV